MGEKKSLDQLGFEAFEEYVSSAEDYAPSPWVAVVTVERTAWGLAAQAIRAAVIEECAKACDEFAAEQQTYDERKAVRLTALRVRALKDKTS